MCTGPRKDDPSSGMASSILAQKRVRNCDVIVLHGDAFAEDVDAIANPTNSDLEQVSTFSQGLIQRGGQLIVLETQRLREVQGKLTLGEAVHTISGKLRAKFIIHTAVPIWSGGANNEEKTLSRCVESVLTKADELSAKSLAVPSLATGVFGFPLRTSNSIVVRAAVQAIADGRTRITSLRFINSEHPTAKAFAEELINYLSQEDVRLKLEQAPAQEPAKPTSEVKQHTEATENGHLKTSGIELSTGSVKAEEIKRSTEAEIAPVVEEQKAALKLEQLPAPQVQANDAQVIESKPALALNELPAPQAQAVAQPVVVEETQPALNLEQLPPPQAQAEEKPAEEVHEAPVQQESIQVQAEHVAPAQEVHVEQVAPEPAPVEEQNVQAHVEEVAAHEQAQPALNIEQLPAPVQAEEVAPVHVEEVAPVHVEEVAAPVHVEEVAPAQVEENVQAHVEEVSQPVEEQPAPVEEQAQPVEEPAQPALNLDQLPPPAAQAEEVAPAQEQSGPVLNLGELPAPAGQAEEVAPVEEPKQEEAPVEEETKQNEAAPNAEESKQSDEKETTRATTQEDEGGDDDKKDEASGNAAGKKKKKKKKN
eukprot:TRINITY_DN840_c0_g2_i3.p1 TRINITY_DN840_c0_g2~~TRINITY_DN840_c0_g2_i3.p1  ORF type:complete len:593 (+),score=251.63 TRINITY_DN840_c0_g2_i3:127-1905(+)